MPEVFLPDAADRIFNILCSSSAPVVSSTLIAKVFESTYLKLTDDLTASSFILSVGMSEENKHFYEFGPFRLDPLKRRLMRDGEPVRLTPKAFDLLLVLVEERGRTVEKDW